MPELKDLPIAFRTFTGNPADFVPEFENQALWKTDTVGGNPGPYRATGNEAGQVEAANGLGRILTGEGSPLNVITPVEVGQLYIRLVQNSTNKRLTFYRAENLSAEGWLAIGGDPIYQSGGSTPVGNVTSEYRGQSFIWIDGSSIPHFYVATTENSTAWTELGV